MIDDHAVRVVRIDDGTVLRRPLRANLSDIQLHVRRQFPPSLEMLPACLLEVREDHNLLGAGADTPESRAGLANRLREVRAAMSWLQSVDPRPDRVDPPRRREERLRAVGEGHERGDIGSAGEAVQCVPGLLEERIPQARAPHRGGNIGGDHTHGPGRHDLVSRPGAQQRPGEGDGQQGAGQGPHREQDHLQEPLLAEDISGRFGEETEGRELHALNAVPSEEMDQDRDRRAEETRKIVGVQHRHYLIRLLR